MKQYNDGLMASYKISLLIAKTVKPHSIWEELNQSAISELITTVMHKYASCIVKKIPLSNSTVHRRINDMSQDVEFSLCEVLRRTTFSLQLDKITLPNNDS
ncbi:SCAN domain-containing protein 3 [Dictyocoela muelleri]|nr:SCAN domain-containing protein 3 [Dictyocoela muelleri]